ncbi:hypothetical protein TRFO_21617 [Tritrichomonas foetus]|uniref:Uncharacterized protein n=1 Tax=Tritrichomonas foetus TaxID=1144522 RepID=A0A1J4KEG2_9EUKA|nr:hypothetical protein TRFO_21617 [Tritrichomonas foetus]|eukprot:OHT09402.1 hypothetical protein TRFO_21617 [Tritrichomonas foetus]
MFIFFIINSPTEDYLALRDRAFFERGFINWYNPETVDFTSHNFFIQMQKLARTVRNSSLISLYLFHKNELPHIIDAKSIANEIVLKHADLFRLINPMFLQIMTHILGEYIQNPSLFAKAIHDFFSDDPSDLLFFAHITFPSLYSFSYIPDLMSNAVDLVMNLLNIDPGDITAHFASALYLTNPRFNDELWTTFFRELRRNPNLNEFNVFISSLSVACKHLSPSHSDLSQKIFKIGRGVFSHIFIDFLFQPSLKIHLKCDLSSKCFKCSLSDDFKSIRINPECDKLTLIYEKMSTVEIPENESLLYGGFTGIGLNQYPVYLSAYELRLIFNIINGVSNRHANAAKALLRCKKEEFEVFVSGEFQIRKALSDLKKPPPVNIICNDLSQFIHTRIKSQNKLKSESKNEKENDEIDVEFQRCFAAVEKYAKDNHLDTLSLIEPSLFDDERKMSFRNFSSIRKSLHFFQNDEFKKFVYSSMIHKAETALRSFEKNLTFLQYQKQYSIVMNCAYPFFDKLLNHFVFTEEDFVWPTEIDFRAKLFTFNDNQKLHNLTSNENNTMAASKINKCQVKTVEIELCDRIIKEMIDIKNEFDSALKTSISDQIQIIPQIVNEIESVIKIAGNNLVFTKLFEMILKSDFGESLLTTLSVFKNEIRQYLPPDDGYAKLIIDNWGKIDQAVHNLLSE